MLCWCFYSCYEVAQSLSLDQLHASVYLFYFYHKYSVWENREFVPNLVIHCVVFSQAIGKKNPRHTKKEIDCLWRRVLWFDTQPVVLSLQVFADATLIFPLLVAETFAVHADKKTTDKTREWIESSSS